MPSAIAVRNVGTIGRADALPAYVPRIFTVINKLLDHLAISILFGPHEDFHLIANLHEIKGIICEVGSYRRTAKKRPPSRSLQLRENGGRLKNNRRFNSGGKSPASIGGEFVTKLIQWRETSPH